MKKGAAVRYAGTAALLGAAVLAGFMNGLIGTGGGVIMFYAFRRLVKSRADGVSSSEKDAFASVIAVILPTSLVSALTYAARGNVSLDEVTVMLIPALAAGIAGAYLSDRLNTDVLRAFFTAILLFSGFRMLIA